MRRVAIFLVVALLSCGCGNQNDQGPGVDDTKLQRSIAAMEEAMAVAESKDPAVRLSAWQRAWIKDDDYSQPKPGVFETQRNEFRYRWAFKESDAVLTGNEQMFYDRGCCTIELV